MALLIKYGTISPIGAKDEARKCACCSRDGIARWALRLAQDAEFWCAKCLLYETEWGRQNARARDEVVELVEREIRSKITDSNGVLTDDGADRIMVSTVMISAYNHGKNHAKNTGT